MGGALEIPPNNLRNQKKNKNMPVYKVKQIPDPYAEATGLSKYKRSRMPGCKDGFYAREYNGRRVTGIDEFQMGLSKEKSESRKEKRESLEKLLGRDLSATSTFWDEFKVEIPSDEDLVLNSENPVELLKLTVLLANGYVAPDLDSTGLPEYLQTQYYIYTEESVEAEDISSRKKRDKAISQLAEISDDVDKMLLYGQFLEGPIYHQGLKENTLYKMLRSFIENKDIKNADKFSKALAIPASELQQKIIVDKALKQGIIAKNSIGKGRQAYQFGSATLGTDIDTVYRNLALPEFAAELMAIKKELDR